MNQQQATAAFFDLAHEAGKAAGYVKGLIVGLLFGVFIGGGIVALLWWLTQA